MSEHENNLEVRERLIRIETIAELNHNSFIEFQSRIAIDLAEVKKSASKAHERIDAEVGFRNRLTGIGISVAVVLGIIYTIFQMVNHPAIAGVM